MHLSNFEISTLDVVQVTFRKSQTLEKICHAGLLKGEGVDWLLTKRTYRLGRDVVPLSVSTLLAVDRVSRRDTINDDGTLKFAVTSISKWTALATEFFRVFRGIGIFPLSNAFVTFTVTLVLRGNDV
uniref:Uncharacterized protein n=1 Tax=Vespula pensylvanica TaxID=30213 RepID=A0A834KQE4_VESPE|nr:hypothetical protein H0235_013287 [Vespula pensylvanica]